MGTDNPETNRTAGPLSEREQLRKDTSESPGSEQETAAKQQEQRVPADVDANAVRTLPGTGGPDDAGDIEVDPEEINLPTHDA